MKNNGNMGIYRGTCKSAKLSPTGISFVPPWLHWIHAKQKELKVLLQFASGDRERKSFQGEGGEGGRRSSREKPDHMAKPIWYFALTKAVITRPSLACSSPLLSCTPTHTPAHSGTHDNSPQGNSAHWVSLGLGL